MNLDLGKIAEQVKSKIGAKPMVILTNSSLFYRGDVRRNLSRFDLVVAKLDAGNDDAFRLINRPADKKLNMQTITDSIRRLKKEIRESLALEVMLLQSDKRRISNVERENLKDLVDAAIEIERDIVQSEVPYRPPSENYVQQPSQEKLRQVSNEFSKIFGLIFAAKMMERGEKEAKEVYAGLLEGLLEAERILRDELEHEELLIDMIDEEKIGYIGSMVLWLNDALVGLTGAPAGFTFTLQNSRLIGAAGLITGIAASLSMSASEYLPQNRRKRAPIRLELHFTRVSHTY